MAKIPYRTVDFTSPALGPVPQGVELDVSQLQLMWAAVTVGVDGYSATTGGRPSRELVWRTNMLAACVEERGERWVKTAAYVALDPSEKGAVSYFLGMAVAQLMATSLLGVPSLVHLDAYLRQIGRRMPGSRPDFLGFDPAGGKALAVEAKGRSNMVTDDVVEKAKEQARLLPTVLDRHRGKVVPTRQVASVAWFDDDKSLHAYLADPPQLARAESTVTGWAVLASHYARVASTTGLATLFNYGQTRPEVELPGTGVYVSMPTEILEILEDHRVAGEVAWSQESLDAAGAEIASTQVDTSSLGEEYHGSDAYVGSDNVGIRVSEPWWEYAEERVGQSEPHR